MKTQLDDFFIINQMRDNPKCLIRNGNVNEWYKSADLVSFGDIAGAYVYFSGQQYLYIQTFNRHNCAADPYDVFRVFLLSKIEHCRRIIISSLRNLPKPIQEAFEKTPGQVYFLTQAEALYLQYHAKMVAKLPEVGGEDDVIKRIYAEYEATQKRIRNRYRYG